MSEQLNMATHLLDELHSDGVAEDLDELTLLDIMGVCGLSFAKGAEASAAYLAELSTKRTA